MSDLEDSMNQLSDNLASPNDMVNQVSFLIFGAAMTTTRAFKGVRLKVDPETNWVFVSITLRWWAKFDKFKRLHEAWLRIAQKRCVEHAPEGWRVLCFYERKEKNERTDINIAGY